MLDVIVDGLFDRKNAQTGLLSGMCGVDIQDLTDGDDDEGLFRPAKPKGH